MKISLYHTKYFRYRRAVSPIISTILMIALATAAAVSVTVVLNSIDTTPTVETSDTGITQQALSDTNMDLNVSITQANFDLQIYSEEGKKYYTKLIIGVNYTGGASDPDYIYIVDIDIFVYGQKLDDIAQWEITSATNVEIVTDTNGNFVSFNQTKNTSADYIVELSDPSIKEARIAQDTSFSYVLKYGEVPGLISETTLNEQLSKTIFSTERERVAVVHFKQKASDNTTALAYWEDVLSKNNGSNNIYFQHNSSDIYDINNNDLVGLNMTWFTEYYNLVIFAEWGIHKDASSFANEVFKSNTPMVFGGTIAKIRKDLNSTAIQDIQGVIPATNGKKEKVSRNWYQFNTSTSSILLDLSGAGENPYVDLTDYDTADIDSTIAKQYGESHVELWKKYPPKKSKDLKVNHTGVLLAVRDANVTAGTPSVSTLVINQYLATYAKTAFRNMLFYAFSGEERILVSNTEIRIDNFMKTMKSKNKGINFEFNATVVNGDIKANTFTFTLIMSKDIKWKTKNYDATVYIGADVLTIPFKINTGKYYDTIELNIGTAYGKDIVEGTVISIDIPDTGYLLFKKDLKKDRIYVWTASIEWLSVDDAYGAASSSV